MPNNNKDSTVTGNTGTRRKQADTPAVSTGRRKLIKASVVAVPAIMTLRSGAVAAAASIDCRDKDAVKAADADMVLGDQTGEPAADEWLRVPAKVGKKVTAEVGGVVGVYYCVEKKDSSFYYYDSDGKKIKEKETKIAIEAGTPVNCFYVYNNPRWECTIADEGCSGMGCTVSLPTGGKLTKYLANSDKFKEVQLLAHVSWSSDGMVDVITYYPQAADITAAGITASCLCSVDPDFNIMG